MYQGIALATPTDMLNSGSSVYLSASCPDAATLAAARIDAEAWIAVVPPSG